MEYKSKFKAAEIDGLLEQMKNGGTGGGVPIVDSVDKLSADAPAGSVAVVAVQGSAKEYSFRDLFQPTPDMIDQATGTLLNAERLSSVTSLNIFAPSSLEGLEMASIYIVPRTFSMTNQNLMVLYVQPEMGLIAMIASETGYEQLNLVTYPEGTHVINQEAIDQINATLASDDWCYLSCPESGFVITDAQFNAIDKFVKVVSGVPSVADIYIKKDAWEIINKKDFEKLTGDISKLQEKLEKKADPIKFGTTGNSYELESGIYYKETVSSASNLSFRLVNSSDATKYSEYILSLKCNYAPKSVTFTQDDGTELSVIWANGVVPVFESGMTYLISIVDGFGIYTQFPN